MQFLKNFKKRPGDYLLTEVVPQLRAVERKVLKPRCHLVAPVHSGRCQLLFVQCL